MDKKLKTQMLKDLKSIILNLIGISIVCVCIYTLFFYVVPKKNAERAKEIEARKIEAGADWAAKQVCGAWIKSVANHPSTVDLHLITGSNVTVAPNGRRIVFLIFDAKNSFGLELRQKAVCLISPQGEFIEASISE